jgi:uncharacterized protein (TIGR03437 family)
MLRSAMVLPLLLAAGLYGQTVESIPLRAVLSSGNVTQQPGTAASGNATIWLHVMRDADGRIVSGSVDSGLAYDHTGPISGIQIHRGEAGSEGAGVVPFTVNRTEASGIGSLPAVQTAFPNNAVTAAAIQEILDNPGQFYFNVTGANAQQAVMRGQLQRAETLVRMAIMTPENEVPVIARQTWSATGTLMLIFTRDALGAPNSAHAIFDVNYRGFPEGTVFTGLHIHRGAAGTNGPVTIDSGLRGQVAADASGNGVLHYENEVDLNRAGALDTVNLLINNPSQTYMNLHTAAFPGGAARGQMLFTDRMDFQLDMTTANEVPPITGLDANAGGRVTVYTVRGREGAAQAGVVVFNINPAFPQSTEFTGLHIHDGIAGQNAGVTIDTRLTSSPLLFGTGGTGNITRMVTIGAGQALTSLNSLIVNPSRHYVNLHTSTHRGGAVRAQLAPVAGMPAVTGVFGGVPGTVSTRLAPGAPVVIRGTSLANVGTDLSGFNNLQALPNSLNGVFVTIDGMAVPLAFVSPTEIRGQIPFEVNPGNRTIIVTTPGGASQTFIVNIAAAAPVILAGPNGFVAQRADGSAVTQANPARSGETIFLTVAGLGRTNPPLQTGAIVAPGTQFIAGQELDARIGGRNTTVLSAIAVPGMTAVYRVAIRVPDGIMSGNNPILLQSGMVTSNVVAIPIQ